MSNFELPPEWQDMIRRMRQLQLSPEMRDALAKAAKYEIPPATRGVIATAVESATEGARRLTEYWQQNFATLVTPTLEQWSLQLPKIEAWAEAYGPALADMAVRFQQAWDSAMPKNWADLSPEEVMGVIDRVRDKGYCLVWLPRPEIIREVLAADEADTGSALLARRDEVLDDADAVLADCTQPELQLEREAAVDAIDALRSGRHRAAQALASSVFTSTLHVFFQNNGMDTIKKLMADEDPDDAAFSELRLRTIYLAGASALERFVPETALPVPDGFNRHNCAHRVTREQWTEGNALAGVMLAVGLLRELDFWLRLAQQQRQVQAAPSSATT